MRNLLNYIFHLILILKDIGTSKIVRNLILKNIEVVDLEFLNIKKSKTKLKSIVAFTLLAIGCVLAALYAFKS